MENYLLFDNKLYENKMKIIKSQKFRKVFAKYPDKDGSGYGDINYWKYYVPILVAIEQLVGKIEGKNILEIGCRYPVFLDYLNSLGTKGQGIDISPRYENRFVQKMNISNLNKQFIAKNKGKFDVIYERLTFSRWYDDEHELKTGKKRFEHKEKILKTINLLLKRNGTFILLDDRGTMFTLKQFVDAGFEKCLFEMPILFGGKTWNVIVAYKVVN